MFLRMLSLRKTRYGSFSTYLEYEWQRSDEIDKLMESLPKSKLHNLADVPNIIRTNNMSSQVASAKIGRNEKCPCGSEKKYKKCCGF
ncbi:MAG: Protein translocase subunit SecA [Acinetobacter bereziniae]|uniref:Protein translocase subunit SecA n=1 Tax=Acinetobacter bereziniae TaxID=106648 RepID=A0A833TT78_ACIBZ|nr:MAG: Protein translocase subunit SecA [Acinetobacter bereziniae]